MYDMMGAGRHNRADMMGAGHERNMDITCPNPIVEAGTACEEEGVPESVLPLAQAYVPFQIYREGFCPDQALKHGTLFPELVRPYC